MLEHEQEHRLNGTSCFDVQDVLDIYLDSDDPENRRKAEEIFGLCEW